MTPPSGLIDVQRACCETEANLRKLQIRPYRSSWNPEWISIFGRDEQSINQPRVRGQDTQRN